MTELPPTSLDDPERWERLVTSIVEAGKPLLAERRPVPTVETIVAGWSRQLLIAAAVLFVVVPLSFGALASRSSPTTSLAGSLMPETYAAWVSEEYQPSILELVASLEELP